MFDALMVFLQEFKKKDDFEKNQQTTKKHAKSLWLIYISTFGLVTSNCVRVNIRCLQIFENIRVTDPLLLI